MLRSLWIFFFFKFIRNKLTKRIWHFIESMQKTIMTFFKWESRSQLFEKKPIFSKRKKININRCRLNDMLKIINEDIIIHLCTSMNKKKRHQFIRFSWFILQIAGSATSIANSIYMHNMWNAHVIANKFIYIFR